jgi:hypothetical protein
MAIAFFGGKFEKDYRFLTGSVVEFGSSVEFGLQ